MSATDSTAAASFARLPSPTSLALCLAYVAYENPAPPPRGPLLRHHDARQLAAWLGASPLAQPPQHTPALALHLVWLVAAGLLIADRAGLRLAPTAVYRLHQPPARLQAELRDAAAPPAWRDAAARLRLPTVPDDFRPYAQQTLARCDNALPAAPPAVWETAAGDTWRLCLRPDADPALLFDLLAAGHYAPDGRLTLSPLTLGAPPARALGFDRLRWLLETATDAPLTAAQTAQLRAWLQRRSAYRLSGPLLFTAQPHQLAALYAARRLRPYLRQQIAPRCALFDRAGLPALRRRLADLGYPLDAPPAAGDPARPAHPPPSPDADAGALYLGLRLLTGVQRLVHCPGPLPHAALDRLAAALPAGDLAALDAQADHLLADLQSVIHGRDPFYPAAGAPAPELLARLRAAIADEQPLTLDYCPPTTADPSPTAPGHDVRQHDAPCHDAPCHDAPCHDALRRHTVDPLRLEQRAGLTYLIAYSHRAQTTLTFRLDRLHLPPLNS